MDGRVDPLCAGLRALRLQPGDLGLGQGGLELGAFLRDAVMAALPIESASEGHDHRRGGEHQGQARAHFGSPRPSARSIAAAISFTAKGRLASRCARRA